MRKLLLSCLITFTFPLIGECQLLIDSVLTEVNITQDTVPMGSVLSFEVNVVHADSNPFTGNIYLVSGVDSSLGINSIDTVGSTFVTSLFNDTVNILFTDTVSENNGYRLGGNIVVVWPVASGLIGGTPINELVDTFRTDIYVIEPISSGSTSLMELQEGMFVYPNPFSGVVNIKSNKNDVVIEELRVFGLNGESVIQTKLSSGKVNLSELPIGIYYIEIVTDDQIILRYKLMKQ